MDKVKKGVTNPVILSVFLVIKNLISSNTRNTFAAVTEKPAATVIFDLLLVAFSVLLALLVKKIYSLYGDRSNLLVLFLILEPFVSEYLGDTFNLLASIFALLFLVYGIRQENKKAEMIEFIAFSFVSALVFPTSAFGIVPAVFVVMLLTDEKTGDGTSIRNFVLSVLSAAAGFCISVVLSRIPAVSNALGTVSLNGYGTARFIFSVGVFTPGYIFDYLKNLVMYWIPGAVMIVLGILIIRKNGNVVNHAGGKKKKGQDICGFPGTEIILTLVSAVIIAAGDILVCSNFSTGLMTVFSFMMIFGSDSRTEKYINGAVGFFDRHLVEISIAAGLTAAWLLDKDTGSPFFTSLMFYA